MTTKIRNLIERAWRARREDRLSHAYRLAKESVALAREAAEPRPLVEALKTLAQVERDLGHEDTARPRYEEAVELCRGLADPLLLAHTVRHLGDLHRKAERPALAEPCYEEALAIYRSHPGTSPLDLANSVRPMALLQQKRGEPEMARRLWMEAKDLYKDAGVREGVAECRARLAVLSD